MDGHAAEDLITIHVEGIAGRRHLSVLPAGFLVSVCGGRFVGPGLNRDSAAQTVQGLEETV